VHGCWVVVQVKLASSVTVMVAVVQVKVSNVVTFLRTPQSRWWDSEGWAHNLPVNTEEDGPSETRKVAREQIGRLCHCHGVRVQVEL